MTKKLLVVAASGLVLAVLLLSAAWAIGGRAMLTAIHSGGWHWTFDDDDRDGDHAAKVMHSLTFDPGAPLTLDAPVDVHFVRGDHVEMTISGSSAMISAMRWQNNRLSMSDTPIFGHRSLNVEIVAPQLPPLTLAGAGDVSIEKLDQDNLRLELVGAGNIEASGKVRSVAVNSSGAGNVDLEQLDATDATVVESGTGNIDVSADGKVNATMSGTGNVSLHRKPTELTSRVTGVGSIDQDY